LAPARTALREGSSPGMVMVWFLLDSIVFMDDAAPVAALNMGGYPYAARDLAEEGRCFGVGPKVASTKVEAMCSPAGRVGLVVARLGLGYVEDVVGE